MTVTDSPTDTPANEVLGQPRLRREDPALLTGEARFTNDLSIPGALHLAVLRSPYAHARINSIDTTAAASAPGVLAVYTGADLAETRASPMPCAWPVTDDMRNPAHYPLARDTACYVGDGVACVVATSEAEAHDTLDLIDVDYEPLDAVVDPEDALTDRVVVHDDLGTNTSYTWDLKVEEHEGDVDRAFEQAAHTVSERYVQQRLIPMAMEPRAVAAVPQPFGGDITLYSATQIPHILKAMTALTPGIPLLGAFLYAGVYELPKAYHFSCTSVFTNMTPTDAYRGAGPQLLGDDHRPRRLVALTVRCRARGIDPDDIDVLHSDTAISPLGLDTYGSRSLHVGGVAVAMACDRVIDKARAIAAHQLEAAEADLEFAGGAFTVTGSPDRTMPLAAIAFEAFTAHNLPDGLEPNLEAQVTDDPPNFSWPFGTHMCVVEVDTDTGQVDVLQYVAVDDCGVQVNPLIVDGQVYGGVVQGLAQALYEGAVHDTDGNLQSATLADYLVPAASDVPSITLGHTVTPSPTNQLGVKGVGEAGTIGAAPAVINAIVDALSDLGVRDVPMPASPINVWTAIQAATKGASS